MAKKAVAKKEENINELSVAELQTRLNESQEKSFRLRFQHASNPLKNPMEIRWARRQTAKILTVLRQKEKVA